MQLAASPQPLRQLHRWEVARRAVGSVDLLRSIGPRYAWNHMMARRSRRSREDEVRDAVYRAIWVEAAGHLEADVIDLGSGVLEIRSSRRATRVWQQFVMIDDPVTLRVALDKPLTSRLLAAAGLPVPASVEYRADNLRPALEFLGSTGLPCVVKPARGTGGGAGIVCGVASARDLVSATRWASRRTPELLMERQAPGAVYRFLVLHGRLLDVIRTGSATVTGDGLHNVYELIAAENRRRLESKGGLGLTILSVDRDCLMTLTRSHRSLKTIPAPHERVAVKTATNDSCVSDNSTVTQEVSPGLVDDVIRAAATTGVQLAGVDVITSDLGQDLKTAAGVVVEVNGGPALHRHYHVEDRSRAKRVAIPILKSVLERAPALSEHDPHHL